MTARPSATGSPIASEVLLAEAPAERWRSVHWAWLGLVAAAGLLIRLALLPVEGLRDDTDQFVGWVHHIVVNGIGALYDPTPVGPVSFGPVMGLIWAGLGAVDSTLRAATDASDPLVRAVMKTPALLADLGMASIVGYALRTRPRWALTGVAAILLHPAVIDVSAWWGQYESVYLVTALAATVLAVNGRNGWAAAAIAVSLLTKPQAVALILPFAAWFWATGGWRGLARAAVSGVAVIVVLWLPFVAAGGPLDYLRNLGTYQDDIFNVLSLRAWNAWWLLQEAAAGGAFLRDDTAVLGPLTLRHIGYGVAGLLELVIAVAILRRPTPRTLILGLTASVLVFFSFATQMHERYAFGALVFLALLVEEPAARWLSVAFGVVFTLNLLAAIPPTPGIGALLPVAGPIGVAGSIAMLAITAAAMGWLVARPTGPGEAPSPPGP